jgi:hypothetical protein
LKADWYRKQTGEYGNEGGTGMVNDENGTGRSLSGRERGEVGSDWTCPELT